MLKAALIASISVLIFFNVFCYQLYRCDDCGYPEGINCVCPDRITRAMVKMGPMKTYRLLPNGRLEVLVNNQWLRLKYERR